MNFCGKRILVTGSSGFVGKNLIERLKSDDVEVVPLTDQNGDKIDIRNWQKIKEIHDIEGIYHLAAVTYVPYSFENPRETYDVNVLGTLNILELCRLRDIEKMVLASSYVYGQPQYLPIDEKHTLHPANPYSRSKVLCENLCRAYHEDYGLKCVILRVFNIYGETQSSDFLIPSILEQIARGEIELNDPDPKRDFLYIQDAVEAFMQAGNYDKSDFGIFNIGYGASYSVDEIVRKLIAISGREVAVCYQNKRRRNEIMNVVADIKMAKEKLGWEPRVDIEEGLETVFKHYNIEI